MPVEVDPNVRGIDPEQGIIEVSRGWKGVPQRPSALNPLALPRPLSGRQKFYILVLQGLGAGLIDASANFGIACAMYRTCTPDSSCNGITMWNISRNTIAGDCAVTVFIQGILTFVISSGMVHVDLRNRKVDPFPYPWPDTNWGATRYNGPDEPETEHGKTWRTLHNRHGLGLGLHFFSGSFTQDVFDFSKPWKLFFTKLIWSAWKGSVLSALYFLVLWPITIAIIVPIWHGQNLEGTWVPEGIKAVFGFVLGVLMTPVVACIALGSEDAIRSHLRESQIKELAASGLIDTQMTEAERAKPAPLSSAQSPMMRSVPDMAVINEKGPVADVKRASSVRTGSPRASLDEKRGPPAGAQEDSPSTPTSPRVQALRDSLSTGHRRKSPRSSLEVSRPAAPEHATLDSQDVTEAAKGDS